METQYTAGLLIPAVAGLTQIFHPFKIPQRFMPVISIAIGIGLVFLVGLVEPIRLNIMAGIVIGLSASGLYDVVKKTVAGK